MESEKSMLDNPGSLDVRDTTGETTFKDMPDSKKAEKLAKIFEHKLIWDDVEGEWYFYHEGVIGTHWMKVANRLVLREIDKEIDKLLPEGHQIYLLKSMESYLQIKLSIFTWPGNREELPMANGVFSFRCNRMRQHRPIDRMRWVLPYEYDEEAKCQVFMDWLKETTGDNADVIQAIRAAMYFSLRGTGHVQKFMEIVGPGGTGKSTFVRIMERFIGKGNHVTTDLKNLEGNKFETASLYGMKVAFINDSSKYGGDVSVLKAATGGDPLRLEKKNKQQCGSFVATCFFFIVSNDPIQSTDYSSGLSRRRVPVTFNRQITEDDREKWRDSGGIEPTIFSEMPGIFNWVLDIGEKVAIAALGGVNGKLTKSQLKHLVETNKLANWMEDNCVFIPSLSTYTGIKPTGLGQQETDYEADTKLYPNYFRWCSEHGIKPLAVNTFGRNLDDLLVSTLKAKNVNRLKKDKVGRAFSGIAIRTSNHDDIDTPVLSESLGDA